MTKLSDPEYCHIVRATRPFFDFPVYALQRDERLPHPLFRKRKRGEGSQESLSRMYKSHLEFFIYSM